MYDIKHRVIPSSLVDYRTRTVSKGGKCQKLFSNIIMQGMSARQQNTAVGITQFPPSRPCVFYCKIRVVATLLFQNAECF